MAELLIVTPDSLAGEQIEALAAKQNLSCRTVSTLRAGAEWLSMQRFDALLVEAGPDAKDALGLIETGWKHHPLLHAAVFSFRRDPEEKWKVIAAGAPVLSGPDVIFHINSFLSALSRPKQAADTDCTAVLYVEDLDSPREIMATYIRSLGYATVNTASSAEQALQLLEASPQHFFCVIVDILMPGTNGIVLTDKIRRHPRLEHLPIIILTASPTASHFVDCLRAGASGFLAKPPQKMALLKELEKAKRMVLFRQSPRLCTPEQAHHLEDALVRQGLR